MGSNYARTYELRRVFRKQRHLARTAAVSSSSLSRTSSDSRPQGSTFPEAWRHLFLSAAAQETVPPSDIPESREGVSNITVSFQINNVSASKKILTLRFRTSWRQSIHGHPGENWVASFASLCPLFILFLSLSFFSSFFGQISNVRLNNLYLFY